MKKLLLPFLIFCSFLSFGQGHIATVPNPQFNNYLNTLMYGDSYTANGLPQVLSQLTRTNVFDGGIAGQTSTQIKTRFIADSGRYNWNLIIEAGRNNYSSPTTVKADIATMVAALGHKRYMILTVPNGAYTNEWSGTGNYTTIAQLNTDLVSIYGSHVVDWWAYLKTLGGTSGQDSIDRSHSVVPVSLRTSFFGTVDSLHINTNAQSQVIQYIVNNYLGLLEDSSQAFVVSNGLLNQSSYAGFTPLSFSQSIRMGWKAGNALTPATLAFSNNFIGHQSGLLCTSCFQNTGNGYQTLMAIVSNRDNTAVGNNSQNASIADFNTSVGSLALWKLKATRAANNTVVGYGAAQNDTSSLGLTFLGNAAGNALLDGDNDIFIGPNAASTQTHGSKNLALCNTCTLPDITGSNQMNIANIIYCIGCNNAGLTPSGQLGIGTYQPDPSALVDLYSTTKGILLPRMSTTQINAISSPHNGLHAYDSVLQVQKIYDGSAWQTLAYLNSPAFLGTPTVPIPSAHDSSTKAAPTSYVDRAIGQSTNIGNRDDLLLQSMGSAIITYPPASPAPATLAANTMAAGFVYLVAVELTTSKTITGVCFSINTLGVYTPSGSNQVGFYSVSGGTATLVASSTTNGTLWSAGSTNTLIKQAFSSTYAAAAGHYYIAIVWGSSATTTSPKLWDAAFIPAAPIMDFTNSERFNAAISSSTLPATITMSTFGTGVQWWLGLY